MSVKSVKACKLFDELGRNAAAQLVIAAFPEFYRSLQIPRDRLESAISADLASEEPSECSDAICVLSESSSPIGVLAAYRGSEMHNRQRASMFTLASSIDDDAIEDVFERVAIHAGTLPEIPDESFYLARIAVEDAYRGSDVADQLMRAFEANGQGFPILSLHVLASNRRAIRFYQRHGYEVRASGSAYAMMSKCQP